jgi:hypothetical protein
MGRRCLRSEFPAEISAIKSTHLGTRIAADA